VSGLAFQEWTIGQMTLSSQLQNRRVAFTAQSEEKNGTAELQAAVVLSDTPSYEANLRTRAFDLKKIAAQKPGLPAAKINMDAWLKLAGIDASGSLKIDGSIAGSLQAPQLDGKANFNQLQMAAHRVQSGSLRWTLAGSRSNSWQGKIDLAAQHVTAGISLPSLE